MQNDEQFENIAMYPTNGSSQMPTTSEAESPRIGVELQLEAASSGIKRDRKNKSSVWHYFIDGGPNKKAICTLCNRPYSRYPSTLRSHLERFHKDEFVDRVPEGNNIGSATLNETPVPWSQSLEVLPGYAVKEEPTETVGGEQSELDRLMMNAIQDAAAGIADLPPSPALGGTPPPAEARRPRKNKSNVWEFFEYNALDGKAVCTLCQRSYSKYTSTMRQHLDHFHKEEWNSRLCEEGSDSAGALAGLQALQDLFSNNNTEDPLENQNLSEEAQESLLIRGAQSSEQSELLQTASRPRIQPLQATARIIKKSKRGRKRNSTVWDYFEYNAHSEKAVCTFCNRAYSKYPSTLRDHLERCHASMLKKPRLDDRAISSIFIRPAPSPLASSPQGSGQEPLHALTDLFANTSLPLALVDRPEFRQFASLLNPAFELPDSEQLQESLLQQYGDVKRRICDAILGSEGVSLSTAIWTAEEHGTPFLSVNAHFVSREKGRILSPLLDMRPLPEKYCIDDVVEVLNRALAEFDLESSQVEGVVIGGHRKLVKTFSGVDELSILRMTSDSDSKMECNRGLLEQLDGIEGPSSGDSEALFAKRTPCFMHSLESALNRALDACEASGRELLKVHAYARRTQEAEDIYSSSLITRWNSLLGQVPHLEENDIAFVHQVSKIVTPFEKFSKLMENQDDITISSVLPFIRDQLLQLQEEDDDGSSELKRALALQLQSFLEVGASDVGSRYLLATYLDPNFFFTLTPEEISDAEELLLTRMLVDSTKALNDEESSPSPMDEDMEDVPEFCRRLYAAQKKAAPTKPSRSIQEMASEEVRKYREAQQAGQYSRTDTIQFWIANGNMYLMLHRQALRILAQPASSISRTEFAADATPRRDSPSLEASRIRTLLSFNQNSFIQ